MALFGEKYGDWVRVVEVEGVSRELCGGTHVANAAEVGIFTILTEGSSAANVRRIEAITGPAAIDWFRARSADLDEAGVVLGSRRDALAGARRAVTRLDELERASSEVGRESAGRRAEELLAAGELVAGVNVVVGRGESADQNALLELADRIKGSSEEAAVVLGGAEDDRVGLVASFSEGAVAEGLSANDVVREAAGIVGGGGGGRANVARAGGRDPEKLDQALDVARSALRRLLGA
jgi:alanyl-tRNA synthetase